MTDCPAANYDIGGALQRGLVVIVFAKDAWRALPLSEAQTVSPRSERAKRVEAIIESCIGGFRLPFRRVAWPRGVEFHLDVGQRQSSKACNLSAKVRSRQQDLLRFENLCFVFGQANQFCRRWVHLSIEARLQIVLSRIAEGETIASGR